MAKKIGEVLEIAAAHKQGKRWLQALKIYRLILEAAPLDYAVRLNISDAIMALGFQELAGTAYTETAKYCAKAGHSLQAIVAAKKAAPITGKGRELFEFIAGLYGSEAEQTGKTSRIAPIDVETPVKEGVELDFAIDTGELVKTTVQQMITAAEQTRFPETLTPLPILSDLPTELFVKLLDQVRLLSVNSGEVIIREGEGAAQFYIIAKGSVAIYKGDPQGKKTELARLGEGSIFGEMALITQSPRTANVETTEESEMLEFDKTKLDTLSQDSLVIEAALERFTKERLVSNLLATNPIFQPFDKKQRYELLSKFTAHEVTTGTILVKEGTVGRGLYIILFGEAEVKKLENGKNVLIATLKSGDIFGEISLIKESPTTATVAATMHSTILFLPKEYFTKLTESIGVLKDYFDKLASQRLTMTQQSISKAREMEDEEVVSEDELIMI